MFDKVADILDKYTKIKREDIKPGSLLIDDLGLNSISYFSIVLDLEETFDIEIADDAASGMKTVGDLVNYIEKLKT